MLTAAALSPLQVETYGTVAELLAVTVPDIVSAVVPVSQNFPVVAACAEAGVRVVSCEKVRHALVHPALNPRGAAAGGGVGRPKFDSLRHRRPSPGGVVAQPIHFSLEEADRLIELCRSKGCLFACGQCEIHTPRHAGQSVRWEPQIS